MALSDHAFVLRKIKSDYCKTKKIATYMCELCECEMSMELYRNNNIPPIGARQDGTLVYKTMLYGQPPPDVCVPKRKP